MILIGLTLFLFLFASGKKVTASLSALTRKVAPTSDRWSTLLKEVSFVHIRGHASSDSLQLDFSIDAEHMKNESDGSR